MKTTDSAKIAFLGFGNMASAMVDGLLRAGFLPQHLGASARRFTVLQEKAASRKILAFPNNIEAVRWADIIVVAVKPHLVAGVLDEVKDELSGKIVLSVAVNLFFDDLEKILPAGIEHLYVLPNTPVSVNEGVLLCETKHSIAEQHKPLIDALLTSLGVVAYVDGAQMKTAGIVSGCGPAFVAMFIESLADGAVKHGVPRALAYKLASQTLAGTAKLQQTSGAHPGAMKDAVCSPGGTTIVGVAALEKNGFRHAVIDAIDSIAAK